MNALRFYRLVRPCFYPKYSHLLSSLPCDLRGKHPLSLHRNQQSWAYRPSSTIPDAERIRRPRSLAVEAPNADSVRYETLNNGRIMKFTWANGETAAFHAVWLRHNCQCPNCVTSSNQKAINPSVVNPKMSVTSSSVSGNSIEMTWSCGHSGYIMADWLQKNQYPKSKTVSTADPSVAMELPRVDGSEILTSDEVLWRWLMNLNEYGVCLLTNLSTDPGAIKEVTKRVYNIQPTVYGETVDVITEENPTNVAYSSDKLNFHMDQTFYENAPGLQLLHCIRFDPCVVGGESIMLDAFPVVMEFRAKHPNLFHILTQIPATYQRIHYERDEPVEFYLKHRHIVLDRTGQVVTAINWNAQLEGPLSVPEEEVLPYYEAYHCLGTMFEESKYKLYHRLEPGEAMTFNNRRMLHSRAAFQTNGGVRHFKGTYVNIDEFKSKFQVLCNQLGHQDYPVKRVFNHQSM